MIGNLIVTLVEANVSDRNLTGEKSKKSSNRPKLSSRSGRDGMCIILYRRIDKGFYREMATSGLMGTIYPYC